MIRLRLACIVLALSLLSVSLVTADRPNVVLIAIDDLNDWVGCLQGHPQARTPHIDALAARGVLFTNAHCQAPLCGPSRASLLSGLYPHSTGMYQQPSKKGIQTDSKFFKDKLLPEYFRQHGYKTMACGKMTHGYPAQMAFEQYGGRFGGSGPKPGGERVRFNYSPNWSLPFTGTQTDWGAFPERDDQMPDHQIATWAVDQLSREHGKPFFLAVGFVRPHVPLYVPQKWFAPFPLKDVAIPEVPDDDLSDVPEIGRRLHEMPRYPQLNWLRENDNDQLRRCVQAYLACTAFVDAQVGRVLSALEASRYADNTVVILFSDHGYHLGEKHRVCKHGLWEEATRVPLIVLVPGPSRGLRCSKPVGLIDIYPSLLELCELPTRAENEGQCLLPLIEDPDADWRFAVLTTYARDNHALRSDRYRYVRYEDGSEELYDHANDPNEWDNISSQASQSGLLKQFRSHLPQSSSPYHPATSRRPVNSWFVEHFRRNGITQ